MTINPHDRPDVGHPGAEAPRPVGPELRGLLTIDVSSELRKLSQAQLQGPWQLPAELVRRALRAGAGRVEVSFARNQVVVVDDGPGLDPAHLEWTAALLDQRLDDDQRHQALTALERAGELALLALAGVEHLRALTIDATHGAHHHQLTLQPAGRPTLVVAPAAGGAGPAGTRIRLHTPGLDRARARRWLGDVARFAPVPVLIDGKPVADGMATALVRGPLRSPLRGHVALLPEGDAAHACLLAFGLVVAHLTIPESLSFEAALEMGTADGALSPARLREASLALVPALADQALTLLIATAPQLAAQDEKDEIARARLARLTLQAARRRQRLPEVERLAVFRTLDGGRAVLVDLVALWQLAASDASGTHILIALSPDDRPDDHALGSGPVLIVDDAERSLLADVLGVRFRAPSLRESGCSFAATLRRLLHQTSRRFDRWGDLLRLPGRPRVLADAGLAGAELAMLSALRAELRARPGRMRAAALCAGRGPVRRTGGREPTLFLPRDNPLVVACVRAFAADPGWMRLIHPALTAGVPSKTAIGRISR